MASNFSIDAILKRDEHKEEKKIVEAMSPCSSSVMENVSDYIDNCGKRKKTRYRTTYSQFQLSELERVFSRTQYPDIDLRKNIAQQIKLDEARIHVWFQNRRAKYKKNKKEFGISNNDYFSINNVFHPMMTNIPQF